MAKQAKKEPGPGAKRDKDTPPAKPKRGALKIKSHIRAGNDGPYSGGGGGSGSGSGSSLGDG